MCIRDRASAVALTQTVLAKALDNALVALALGNARNVHLVASCEDISLQPVSYTHLDVYKRQRRPS